MLIQAVHRSQIDSGAPNHVINRLQHHVDNDTLPEDISALLILPCRNSQLSFSLWEAPSVTALAQFMRKVSAGGSSEELDVSFVEVDEENMYCDIEAVGGEPTGLTEAIDNTLDTTRTALSALDSRFKISETFRNVTAQNNREKSENPASSKKEGPALSSLSLGWLTKNLGNIVAPENSSENVPRAAGPDLDQHTNTAEPLPLTPIEPVYREAETRQHEISGANIPSNNKTKGDAASAASTITQDFARLNHHSHSGSELEIIDAQDVVTSESTDSGDVDGLVNVKSSRPQKEIKAPYLEPQAPVAPNPPGQVVEKSGSPFDDDDIDSDDEDWIET